MSGVRAALGTDEEYPVGVPSGELQAGPARVRQRDRGVTRVVHRHVRAEKRQGPR